VKYFPSGKEVTQGVKLGSMYERIRFAEFRKVTWLCCLNVKEERVLQNTLLIVLYVQNN
jgi:hypothetical protein